MKFEKRKSTLSRTKVMKLAVSRHQDLEKLSSSGSTKIWFFEIILKTIFGKYIILKIEKSGSVSSYHDICIFIKIRCPYRLSSSPLFQPFDYFFEINLVNKTINNYCASENFRSKMLTSKKSGKGYWFILVDHHRHNFQFLFYWFWILGLRTSNLVTSANFGF